MSRHFDAIVIGTGQAGPSLAARLAASGMQVAIVERTLALRNGLDHIDCWTRRRRRCGGSWLRQRCFFRFHGGGNAWRNCRGRKGGCRWS